MGREQVKKVEDEDSNGDVCGCCDRERVPVDHRVTRVDKCEVVFVIRRQFAEQHIHRYLAYTHVTHKK